MFRQDRGAVVRAHQLLNAAVAAEPHEWVSVLSQQIMKPSSGGVPVTCVLLHSQIHFNNSLYAMRFLREETQRAFYRDAIDGLSMISNVHHCDSSVFVACVTLIDEPDDANGDFNSTHYNQPRDGGNARVVSWAILVHRTNFTRHMGLANMFVGMSTFTYVLVNVYKKREEVTLLDDGQFTAGGSAVAADSTPTPAPPCWKTDMALRQDQHESVAWMRSFEAEVHRGDNFVCVPLWLPVTGTDYVIVRSQPVCPALNTSLLLVHKDALTSLHAAGVELHNRVVYKGGVLADRTGTGKTAVVIGLVAATADEPLPATRPLAPARDLLVQIPVRASLVILPMNLCKQWVHELQKFTHVTMLNNAATAAAPANALKCLTVFNKKQYTEMTVRGVTEAHLVLVTHDFLLGQAYPRSAKRPDFSALRSVFVREAHRQLLGDAELCSFRQFLWKRVIYDEQHVRVHASEKAWETVRAIVGRVFWGVTATPVLENIQTVWRTSTSTHSALVFRTIRRSPFVPELRPVVQHEHWVTITPREREMLATYRHEGLPRMVQLCTCFNVAALFGAAEAAAAHAGAGGNDIQVCMTFEDLSRTMVTKRAAEMTEQIPVRDALEAQISGDKNLLALIENAASATAAATVPVRSDTSSDTALTTTSSSSSTEERMIRRRIKVNERRLATMNANLEMLRRQCAFFQRQIELEDSERSCPICMTNATNVITKCGHWFCTECCLAYKSGKSITPCPICKISLCNTDWIQEVKTAATDASSSSSSSSSSAPTAADDRDTYGSKLAAIVELLQLIKRNGEKAVMFVQWFDLLRTLRAILSAGGVKAVAISGNTNSRAAAVRRMKAGLADVLLMSLDVSTTGLHLTEANHVIFSHALVAGSPSAYATVVDQATARVQRIGQDKQVHVHWFVTRDTDEQALHLSRRLAAAANEN